MQLITRSFNEQQIQVDSLPYAKRICAQIHDCAGLTKLNGMYELRRSSFCRKSDNAEESWIFKAKYQNGISVISESVPNLESDDKKWKRKLECVLSGYPSSIGKQQIRSGSIRIFYIDFHTFN